MAAPPEVDVLPVLPPDIIILICSSLDDPSKCAAACLARSWRDAVATPRLWKTVGIIPGKILRLTDARLASLVKRSGGGLTSLYLSAASLITREGLAAALYPRQSKLKFVSAYGDSICGADVAAALTKAYRGRLHKLKVCGTRAVAVPAGGVPHDREAAFWASCEDTLGALRALLAPGGQLDAEAVCNVTTALGAHRVCARLCTREGACACGATCCKAHAHRMSNCMGCGTPICDSCCDFGTPECEDCAMMSGHSDFDPETDL